MQEHELISNWKCEENEPFSGWDFSYLKGRHFADAPPWSYEELVRQLLENADSLLDMGTGGGEKLLEFRDELPVSTIATEGWPANLPVARGNLEPYGIEVVAYDCDKDNRMPFEDSSFAVIINRHEAFDISEVTRILEPGGVFLTQQCGTMDDLSSFFGMDLPFPDVTLANYRTKLREAGLEIEVAEEYVGAMRFMDVGAFVYYARACPWVVPADFSVERYKDRLVEMHANDR